MNAAIKKAIRLAGSKSALARQLNISAQALGKQIKDGQILPKHCIAIEKLFPGEVSRYELDPEHFGSGRDSSSALVILLQKFDNS